MTDCQSADAAQPITQIDFARAGVVTPQMAAVAAAFDKKEGRTGVNAPTFQFMRVGYFCLDNRDSTAEHLVFNRSVSLKDSFKK